MYITQVYLLAIFRGLIHMNKLKWTYLVQKKKGEIHAAKKII